MRTGSPIPIAALKQFRSLVTPSRAPSTSSGARERRPYRSGPNARVRPGGERPGPAAPRRRHPDTRPLPRASGASAPPRRSGVRSSPRLTRSARQASQERVEALLPPRRGEAGPDAKRSGPRPSPDFGLWGADARSARASQKTAPPRSQAAREKQRRRERFQPSSAEGDPFAGPLVWGVGRTSRGVKHALVIYAGVFLLSFMLVSALGMGTREFEVTADESMIYVRSGLLLVAALVGLLGLRKERLERIGLTPRLLPALAALPIAALIGLIATPITRLNIAAGADVGVVAGLLLLRAAGECVFFHGFVTRTLLIELKEPVQAIFISALLYGFYALTFVDILGGSPLNVIFGILVYGFGAGMPLAVIYWRTRSVFAPIACHLIILMMVAMAGLQQAERLAG